MSLCQVSATNKSANLLNLALLVVAADAHVDVDVVVVVVGFISKLRSHLSSTDTCHD